MKILVSVLLVLFLVVGWLAALPKPNTADVTRELEIAREQMDMGAYGAAINYYRRAAAKDESLEVQLQLLDAYETTGKLKEAKALLKTLLDKARPNMTAEPERMVLYGRLADLYAQSGEWQAYIDLAREACGVSREYFDRELSERYFAEKYRPTDTSTELLLAGGFIGNLAVAVTVDGAYYVNERIKVVSGPYHEATPPLSGILAVRNMEDKWQFIDTAGQLYMASEETYDRLWSGATTYVLGSRGGKYYYLNDHCQEVLGPYDEACPFANGVAAVREGGRWFIIDGTGARLTDDNDAWTSEGFLDVRLDDFGTCSMGGRIFALTEAGWRLYDLKGKRVGSLEFRDARPFAGGGFAAVELGDGWAFVNGSGAICCGDLRFQDARSAGPSQLAAVKQDGLWGYILGEEWVGTTQIASWRMVIAPQYEDAGVFSANGLAPVKTNGSWHYIRLQHI
jgi:tetratricopeptide (TPR) repeat protein